jgi:8-amino-7-oxononanoate synthase
MSFGATARPMSVVRSGPPKTPKLSDHTSPSAGPPDLPPIEELRALADAGLLRTLRHIEPVGGPRVRLDGRELVLFCANDYLGLADDPRIAEAAVRAIRESGWGSGASRLISGGRPAHSAFEAGLAAFKGAQAALLLPSGWQANLAAVCATAGPDDCVFLDKLDHASLIDAAKLSGARVRVYPHNDLVRLAELLADAGRFRRRVIVTDSVFSMDGDAAPLDALVELAERHSARLIVDDAHGTGVLGDHGRGAAEHFGVEGRIDLTVGTLSKALGGLGGFVCGSREWIDLVVNRGRAFLFTTAVPAAQAAAGSAALEIVRTEPQRRLRLHDNAARLRAALADLAPPPAHTPAGSPIVPVILGGPDRALAAAEFLRDRGFLVPAIRPPTVPAGTARLRISVSAVHTAEQIDALAAAVHEWFAQGGAAADPC